MIERERERKRKTVNIVEEARKRRGINRRRVFGEDRTMQTFPCNVGTGYVMLRKRSALSNGHDVLVIVKTGSIFLTSSARSDENTVLSF